MPIIMGKPPALNLSATKQDVGKSPLSPSLLSAQSANSPLSSQSIPGSPFPPGADGNTTMHPIGSTEQNGGHVNSPTSPRITAMPDFPPSPNPDLNRHGREQSKSFFSNFKASKSAHKLHPPEASLAEPGDKASGRSRASSKDRSLHSVRRQESTPDLPRMAAQNSARGPVETRELDSPSPAPPGSSDSTAINRKAKPKFGGILSGRGRNPRSEDERTRKPRSPPLLNVETQTWQTDVGEAPLKTAPIRPDWREGVFGFEAGAVNRARSADRQGSHETNAARKHNPSVAPVQLSTSLKESHSIMSNLQSTGRGLGSSTKRLIGKFTRSGSSNEREIPVIEENYVCTTINLPLVQQTRKTRIARRLELSRDKTEFWMPALPWRCIDYLNMNGCEEEGLYRIPGSGREVKAWQKRFDTEFDINLFEEPELYDINIIGSMFKSWLRELPDEILPKATQSKIARECQGATSTPQLLKDELSQLPPFNYYLLFAITCHLSLLHSFAEKNKMDYRNLCICFQPCLKIDTFCFQFLVINWKECWQGCWTEHEYLQEEYRWERDLAHRLDADASDDRAVSSSGSQFAPSVQHQPKLSIDNNSNHHVTHKSSASQLKSVSKGRNPSSSIDRTQQMARNQFGHGKNSSSLSSMQPANMSTPEQKAVNDRGQLPELGNLSPIRM